MKHVIIDSNTALCDIKSDEFSWESNTCYTCVSYHMNAEVDTDYNKSMKYIYNDHSLTEN